MEPANKPVGSLAADLARVGESPIVQAAFLELGRPSLDEAADLLVAQGVDRIAVIPYFLTPGTHLERDLPTLMDRISNKHKDIHILSTAPLGVHPRLAQILTDAPRSGLG